jgi:hypothetical protein
MDRTAFLAVALLVSAGVTGCGQSESNAPTAAAPTSEATATAQAAGPADAVHEFLEAVRLGDDAKAQGMLTELAQKKTTEMNMVVAPPGSDTAKFEVGAMQMAEDGTARVASVWSDLDHEGKRRTDQITWILRQENSQWRIVGMATQIMPDQGPVVLNFENPQELLEKQRQAEEAAARREAETQQLQAAKPQDPFQTERK